MTHTGLASQSLDKDTALNYGVEADHTTWTGFRMND